MQEGKQHSGDNPVDGRRGEGDPAGEKCSRPPSKGRPRSARGGAPPQPPVSGAQAGETPGVAGSPVAVRRKPAAAILARRRPPPDVKIRPGRGSGPPAPPPSF